MFTNAKSLIKKESFKKISKKGSKKNSKKGSKKISKKGSKRSYKKRSKRRSKKGSKKGSTCMARSLREFLKKKNMRIGNIVNKLLRDVDYDNILTEDGIRLDSELKDLLKTSKNQIYVDELRSLIEDLVSNAFSK